ncbi:hypothetical protein Hdeb2414_s0016g00486211 [Helianthus debilis subsp. tardiflorus]
MELHRTISFFLFLTPLLIISIAAAAAACSNGTCKLGDDCEADRDCETGLYCFSCPQEYSGSKCVRSTATPVFNLLVSLLLIPVLIFFIHFRPGGVVYRLLPPQP